MVPGRARFTVEEQLLRTTMIDLERSRLIVGSARCRRTVRYATGFVLQKAPSSPPRCLDLARGLLEGAAELHKGLAIGIGTVLVAEDGVGGDTGV
jgi:hypothetical protein